MVGVYALASGLNIQRKLATRDAWANIKLDLREMARKLK
jgi:hypothetical protein